MSKVDWPITVVKDTNVCVVTMVNPDNKMNVITDEFMDRLEATLDRLDREYPLMGVVFTGAPHIFSAGLNLPFLMSGGTPNPHSHPLSPHIPTKPKSNVDNDRTALKAYIERIDTLGFRLFNLRRPTAAAIHGHAIAGGTFLAAACDYRFMSDMPATVGLNEVRNGFVLPYNFMKICSSVCASNDVAKQWFMSGLLKCPHEARSVGFITEVVPCPDESILSIPPFSTVSPHSENDPSCGCPTCKCYECGCQKHLKEKTGRWVVNVPMGGVVRLDDLNPVVKAAVEKINHKPYSIPAYVITKLGMNADVNRAITAYPTMTVVGTDSYFGGVISPSERDMILQSVGLPAKL